MSADSQPSFSPSAFPQGTFRPNPKRASIGTMLRAQGWIETKLFVRHSEQQILSLVIPLGLLVVMSRLPIIGDPHPLEQLVPMILAVAATSSGFTGPAISLAFDRRYGALKRTGASGVPSWVIIVGKIIAVIVMSLLQVLIISAVAFWLGWRPSVWGLGLSFPILILGVAAFTAMGLLMGGTLSSELVLGLANLIWVLLLGAAGFVLVNLGLSNAGWWNIIPSVALASGVDLALLGRLPITQMIILLVWAIIAIGAAQRWFKFSS
ncbi:ABC transporter permease [Corynebacterium sp. 3HC-13]|uniref:ABC transporter permease n=1 Tax=Corynebacterium poyangense TaxID=2684405 RepID=UPI001CCB51F3|nr:ABC transporter permease [Corynebacterium poyangense]MBZ8177827.1 ABC transporter permease [Corynebacterium poyangense]